MGTETDMENDSDIVINDFSDIDGDSDRDSKTDSDTDIDTNGDNDFDSDTDADAVRSKLSKVQKMPEA